MAFAPGFQPPKNARKLAKLVCKKYTGRAKKKCQRKLIRAVSNRPYYGTYAGTKIRACKPSDKGVKAWRRNYKSTMRAANETRIPGNDEMYSSYGEHMIKQLERRCGRRFAMSTVIGRR